MQPSIEDVLAFEIKKEIADRYFGFRKLIEEDKLNLAEKIKLYSLILEKEISYDLIRIYIMLRDEELIHAFLGLAGLAEKLFYDPYITQSPTIRARSFEGVKIRGLTRAARFKNLLLDCYGRLAENVNIYREKLAELRESHDIIREEINLFYQKNDLTNIMGFFRSLDSGQNSSGPMQGGMEVGLGQSMEDSLRVTAPPPIEQHLPEIPPLVPLEHIRKDLKRLAEQALKKHNHHFDITH